jgi:ribonuclease Z
MTFDVLILGCGAATPTAKHLPTSQLVNLHDKLFLIDCGEGTQMQLRRHKIKMQRIQHIFISHLHGDHYLGLVGLISSMHLLGRKNSLHLYGPPELEELVKLNLKVSQTYLEFPIIYHAISGSELNLEFEDKTLEVYSFPLKHRIPCHGFLFKEKTKPPKIRKEIISEYKLIPSQILLLKNRKEVVLDNGQVLNVENACIESEPPRQYAYCSDTMYWETLVPFIKDSDVLYHESTFLDSESDRAKATFHSTARQAGKIAKMANVGTLILGHYSSRYNSEEDFIRQALEEFPRVVASTEGMIINL